MSLFKDLLKNLLILTNSILLLLVIFTIFFITLFPVEWHKTLYNIFFAVIFISAAYSIEKRRNFYVYFAFVLVALEVLTIIFSLYLLNILSNIVNILFFTLMVIMMIRQIATAGQVSSRVILEAINGYLMLGLAFSLIILLTNYLQPGSFNFPEANTGSMKVDLSTSLYFGFVTFSTLGYGDALPASPFARSLSILTSVTGQLYLATIIALLVGKYSSMRAVQNQNDKS
jgi:voltage-gated potassium channel